VLLALYLQHRISEIVNGKLSITADAALRLERYFGVEAQLWLNLQYEYDLRVLKRKIGPDIDQRIVPVKKMPSHSVK
jgi:plasmid maintenance system antidote protein VapI